MAALFDRVRVETATTGTGSLAMGAAVGGYRTFIQAGVPTSTQVSYVIEDGLAWEIGVGTYTYPSTLTRGFTSSSTGALLNLTGQATVFIGASSADIPSSFATLTTLDDVETINAFLQVHAGETVFIPPGSYSPNFLEAGEPISIPANTTLQALGLVEISSDNPTRQVFNLAGDRAALLGNFQLTGNYTRPNFSWRAGEYTSWATAWNAANPAYAIANWTTQSFRNAWNAANDHSQITPLGPLSGSDRAAAITSYDASNILIDGLTITGFHAGVCLEGKDVKAATYLTANYGSPPYTDAEIRSATAAMQTENNRVVNITLDEFDFGILAKKQRDFIIDNISTEWIGWRVNHGQPHLVYLGNETADYEYSWNVHCGTINAYGYEGGSVFKSKGCLGLSWDIINCRSVHGAVAIVEGCTGLGGAVIVTDHHETTDPVNGAGQKFAVLVSNSPGFVFSGAIYVQQRENEDEMRGWAVDNSDGVRFLQGCELVCAKAADDEYSFRVRSSSKVYSGPTKYTDTNNRNALLFKLSDDQEDGGNASDCVLEFAEVTGSTRLAESFGLSSDNQVWADPTKVATWDATAALVDNGFGMGNALIDPRETVQKVLAVSATTDLSLKASNALTITREGPDPLDEDALPPPYVFANNDTITIGSRTYTWKTTLSGANQIKIPDATLVAAYPTMTAEYGYLQIAFLNAAIMGTTYKGAGAGAIYGTGTAVNSQVESEWGGNQINVRAKAAGAGGNSIACSVSMTGSHAAWATGTLTGGGTADNALLNQTVHVTTGGLALTMTLPSTAPNGSFVTFIIVDQAAGSVVIQTSAGTRLGSLFKSNQPLTYTYTTATGWRSDQEEAGVYDFSLNGGVGDGTTDNATAWANALATADEERLTIRMRAGTYYILQPPGTVVNATLHNCAEVTYDWISLEAVGGEVVFKSPELVTTASSAGLSRAILKANSSTGGTFRMKGVFAFDGGTPATGAAYTGADAQAQCPLEVRGYDLVEFDSIAFRNCRGNWDTRADPGAAGYNASVEPTCSARRSVALFDDNGVVRGRLICETNAREGPFVTQGNVVRDLKLQYVGPSNPANAVSSPFNFCGRFYGTDVGETPYGCAANDKATRLTVERVSGAWRGSFANVGYSGECWVDQLCPITGAVPSTGVDVTTTSTTAHSPGWDFGAEVNPDPSGPLHLNGVWMVNNHRYSIYLTRTLGDNEIELVNGDITVDGGWWGPRISGVRTLALRVRARDIVRYYTASASTPYGSALTINDCGGGWIDIDAEGTLTVPGSAGDPTTRYSYYGVFKENADDVRVSGRVKDFAFRLYRGDQSTSVTDNARIHLFGPMEFEAVTYTIGTDGGKLVQIGRSTSLKVKRAEIASVRYNGEYLLGQGVADIYAYDLPGIGRVRLSALIPEPISASFGFLEWANDDPSSPGAGVRARMYGLTDANGRYAELMTEEVEGTANNAMMIRKLRAHMARNAGGTTYFCPKGYSIGSGTAAVVAGTLYLVPYDEDVLSSALGLNVTVGDGNCRLGLYSSDRNGKEFELIEDLGERSVAGVATVDWPWAATNRRLGGPLWLAALFSGTPQISVFTANVDLHVRHGSSSLTSTTVRTHRTGTQTYGALPATPPTMAWASSNCPGIGVKGG